MAAIFAADGFRQAAETTKDNRPISRALHDNAQRGVEATLES